MYTETKHGNSDQYALPEAFLSRVAYYAYLTIYTAVDRS